MNTLNRRQGWLGFFFFSYVCCDLKAYGLPFKDKLLCKCWLRIHVVACPRILEGCLISFMVSWVVSKNKPLSPQTIVHCKGWKLLSQHHSSPGSGALQAKESRSIFLTFLTAQWPNTTWTIKTNFTVVSSQAPDPTPNLRQPLWFLSPLHCSGRRLSSRTVSAEHQGLHKHPRSI